ncbi:bystin isoform X1 [Raphanus sativus]|uniref:Bystin n=2 Tax=Raphanus sativus TaxID=3726 RepID=A0A6J0LIL8_RAPSA|nr:bystin isoform X1 [Raphanus sativus]XP_018459272.1 bystin isoform X1 [Raphanus sativus]XP_056842157.1 bystin isoform X1 [Raphanus sativus]XP_056842161.1 bystin isoform X1 [Raphanus sativus]
MRYYKQKPPPSSQKHNCQLSSHEVCLQATGWVGLGLDWTRMAKKKRDRIINTQSFITTDDDDASIASSRKRSKVPKTHQQQEKLLEAGISSKIMKVALAQQKEIADEENAESNPITAVFSAASALTAEEEKRVIEEEEDDIDDFDGEFDDDDDCYQEDVNEDDEKLFESFFAKNAPPQRTLANIIIKKIKDNDAELAQEERPDPQMDPNIAKLYKGVAKLMSEYTVGKMPKAFVRITKMERWQDVLYLTEPEKWSPNAMYQATRIFAHHLKNSQIQRFYNYVLLPRVREDIRKNKRLHFALYQAVKKSLYKPSAFNKGILFPLCKSGTCSLREAVILGSILEKCSFPVDHSGIALLNLAEMEYCGTTSYFIKTLLEKKYCMPYRVLDALVAHFMRFVDEIRVMPVIWHQSLLTFVQRYKYELLKEDKEHLQTLLNRQKHHLVTPEIVRELQGSRNRGEKDDPMLTNSFSVTTINNPIKEDRFDIPEVPMEED